MYKIVICNLVTMGTLYVLRMLNTWLVYGKYFSVLNLPRVFTSMRNKFCCVVIRVIRMNKNIVKIKNKFLRAPPGQWLLHKLS